MIKNNILKKIYKQILYKKNYKNDKSRIHTKIENFISQIDFYNDRKYALENDNISTEYRINNITGNLNENQIKTILDGTIKKYNLCYQTSEIKELSEFYKYDLQYIVSSMCELIFFVLYWIDIDKYNYDILKDKLKTINKIGKYKLNKCITIDTYDGVLKDDEKNIFINTINMISKEINKKMIYELNYTPYECLTINVKNLSKTTL